jgi:hypothetical protein
MAKDVSCTAPLVCNELCAHYKAISITGVESHIFVCETDGMKIEVLTGWVRGMYPVILKRRIKWK